MGLDLLPAKTEGLKVRQGGATSIHAIPVQEGDTAAETFCRKSRIWRACGSARQHAGRRSSSELPLASIQGPIGCHIEGSNPVDFVEHHPSPNSTSPHRKKPQ